MPREFEFREPGTDVWTPLPFVPGGAQNRDAVLAGVRALRPGVTVEQAHTELQQLTPAMRDAMKKTADWGREGRVLGMQESVTGDVRPTLLILLGAVGLILLLAAVNLGTLVLSRSLERARRWPCARHSARPAGDCSNSSSPNRPCSHPPAPSSASWFAWLALPVLVSRIPPDMPRQNEIALDVVVFVAVFAVTVLVSIVMALVPVAAAARPALQPLLKTEPEHGHARSPSRARDARHITGRARGGARHRRRPDAAHALESAER